MLDTVQTVLVVDDEDGVRNLIRTLFRLEGFDVITCASGLEALDLLDARGGNVDLLVTDINLDPIMDGVELAENLRRMRPGVKVLYISGMEEMERYGSEIATGSAHFLMKPFKARDLTRKAREILSAITAPSAI